MSKKKLYKSNTDCKICGVCGGVAEYFDIDATLVRLIWACLAIFGGTGLLIYLVAAIVLPEDPIMGETVDVDVREMDE